MLTECDRDDKSALWRAFEVGDSAKVKNILDTARSNDQRQELHELVSCTNHQGQTLFHLAFQNENCSKHCLEMIIGAAGKETLGTILKEKDTSEKYPFHFISKGKDDILKLAASVDKNAEAFRCYLKMHETDIDKESVFQKAARNEDHLLLKNLSRYMKYLKEEGNFPNDSTDFSDVLCKTDRYGQSVLHIACQQGKNKVVKILLRIGSIIGCMTSLFEIKSSGKTAFWKAFEAGDSTKVKIMLDEARNDNCMTQLVSCTNQQDQTLFHLAFQSQNCSEQCLGMVIKANDDITWGQLMNKLMKKKSPFHFISKARQDILKMVASVDISGKAFQHYLNTNKCDHSEQNVFHKAAHNKDHLLLKALSKYLKYLGIAHNLPHDLSGFSDALCKKDENGQSALHIACQQGNSKVVKLLIKIAKQVNCLEQLFRIEDNSNQTFIYHVQDGGKSLLDLLIREVTNLDMESYGKGGPEADQNANQTNGTDGQPDRWFLTHDLLTDKDIHGKSVLEYVPKQQKQWYSAFFDIFASHAQKHSANPTVDDDFIEIPHSNFYLFNKQYKNHHEKLNSSLLRVMERANCTDLINHKYVRSYLRACWWQFASRVYGFTLGLHIILLASLIALVVIHKPKLQVNNDNANKIVFLTSQYNTLAAKFILLICTIPCIFLQFFHIGARRKWLLIDDTTDFIIYFSCLIVSAYSIVFEYELWVQELGVAMIIAASVDFIWMLTKIAIFTWPRLVKIRLRCIMLFHVMSKVCIFLPIYMLFILTFAGAFHIVFQLQEPFAEFGYTIMKSIVMTIGELEFKDMFFDTTAQPLASYTFSLILFTAFLVIMTISTMNLLIGMAVGDIKRLRENSETVAFHNVVHRIFEGQALLEVLTNPDRFCKRNNFSVNNKRLNHGESEGLSQNDQPTHDYVNPQFMSDTTV